MCLGAAGGDVVRFSGCASVGFSVGLSARSQFWLSVLSGLCLCRDQVSVSVLFCASIFF